MEISFRSSALTTQLDWVSTNLILEKVEINEDSHQILETYWER